MTITQRDCDLGTGYAMKPSSTRTELTAVGRGTPMGELLRRYWHPVGLVSDATGSFSTPDLLVPYTPALQGAKLYSQAVSYDPGQPGLPVELGDEFDLGSSEVDRRWDRPQPIHRGGHDRLLHHQIGREDLVGAGRAPGVVDPESRRSVALRIEVHHQNPTARLGQAGTQVDRRGALPNTTLLVRDSDHSPVAATLGRDRPARLYSTDGGVGPLVG